MEHAAFSSLGLGRALRAERRALGLTQQAVADATGYSKRKSMEREEKIRQDRLQRNSDRLKQNNPQRK